MKAQLIVEGCSADTCPSVLNISFLFKFSLLLLLSLCVYKYMSGQNNTDPYNMLRFQCLIRVLTVAIITWQPGTSYFFLQQTSLGC